MYAWYLPGFYFFDFHHFGGGCHHGGGGGGGDGGSGIGQGCAISWDALLLTDSSIFMFIEKADRPIDGPMDTQ